MNTPKMQNGQETDDVPAKSCEYLPAKKISGTSAMNQTR